MKATQKVVRQSQFPQGGWRKRDATLYSSFKGSKKARSRLLTHRQGDCKANATKALSEALRAL
ncbi:hypothetical protein KIT05_58 [Vibrio phage KIT05]|nr:hypothetical protein KIT05_58 [Vibrio phage KIT05]